MKRIHIKIKQVLAVSGLALCLASCDDILDVEPQTVLSAENAYKTEADADAAVLGVYGKFMNLAKQYVILNELRADLMDVTGNADHNLEEINLHTARLDNPYIDPRPFYEVIMNCNDVLHNFDLMKQDFKLDEQEYSERYSDIAALRSWVYLQLAIHYGTVPYVTEPIENIDDLKDQSKFPMLSQDQMIDKLIEVMENLPIKHSYSLDISLMTSVDGYSTEKFFVNKNFLLGDLYLWKGDYTMSATYYKAILNSAQDYDTYKIKWAEVVSNNDLNVGYLRYREQDINTLVNNNSQGWRSMFARSQDALYNTEWIWALVFDSNFAPENPFVEMFAKVGGDYLLKPSQAAIDKWDTQVQYNDFPFDARGIFTCGEEMGDPVIMKYLYNHDPLDPLKKNGKWFLARAALLHLRFAEAANRDGRSKLAWALLNNGIKNTFDTEPSNPDQTNKQATFDVPPYDFDARMGNYPYFRDPWHRNAGIRGRAYLKSIEVDTTVVTNTADSTLFIEEKLLEEAALELAYEGHRWPDLVRIAKRRNDPSFLADKIYEKLNKDGHPEAEAVRQRLMNPKNWYLPFKWE